MADKMNSLIGSKWICLRNERGLDYPPLELEKGFLWVKPHENEVQSIDPGSQKESLIQQGLFANVL